jgi:hypothetical protein
MQVPTVHEKGPYCPADFSLVRIERLALVSEIMCSLELLEHANCLLELLDKNYSVKARLSLLI